ncbi:zinc-ribbon domain-containing protein [Falsihalocynthiibacter sp. S25ZX9]|uniref:zinc-ribbon domain-containing protein n=1 Tax=Falsihalocynthiibacter sp. S25ZX9 TaxID=3240870 RepID=UPI0035103629
MRLICPNCDAHYEVESRLIPENGRDVQCSSCGDTWFQAAATQDDDIKSDLEDDIFAENADQTGDQDAPEIEEIVEAEPAAQAESATTTAQGPERASLDSTLMQVLREEAERETQARLSEGGANLETQTDMGLEAPEQRSKSFPDEPDVEEAVRERTARLRGIEPEDVSDGSPSSRRDLLPDIEEINSTLRATSDRKTGVSNETDEEAPNKRSGFRTGFSLIIVLVAALLLVYTFAPQIGAKVPAIDPALKSFVRSADQGRVKIDTLMETLIAKINTDEAPSQ